MSATTKKLKSHTRDQSRTGNEVLPRQSLATSTNNNRDREITENDGFLQSILNENNSLSTANLATDTTTSQNNNTDAADNMEIENFDNDDFFQSMLSDEKLLRYRSQYEQEGSTEKPEEIRAEILAACTGASEVGDRRAAIRTGMQGLQAGDALIIAGKGHESGQTIGTETFPFNDGVVAREEH